MTKKYQIWWKTLTLQQNSMVPKWSKAKRIKLTHTMVKLLKANGKDKILKAARKNTTTHQGKNTINS